jgi:hypothetical protein
MIGLAVDIVRGAADENAMREALSPSKKVSE